jgi:hypothetical protein
MMFDDFQGLLRVAAVALIAYAAMIAVLRLSGKRSIWWSPSRSVRRWRPCC